MNTHFKPSRRHVLKGGGALVVSFSLAGRIGRRALGAGRGGGQAARADRGRCLSRHRRQGRRSRSIPARSISAPACAPRCAQIVAEELDVPFTRVTRRAGRHGAHARPGHDLGQPHHPDRRHADPQRRGDRAQRAARRGRQAARRQAEGDLTVADGVITGGDKRVSYGELIGGKSFSLKLDRPSRCRPRTRRTTRSSASPIPRVDIPDKVTGTLHLHAGLPRARHAARPRGASAGDRRQARERRRRLDQGHPGIVQGGARGQLPRRRGRERMGRDQGRAPAQGHLVEMGGPARAGQALRARARDQGRQGRGDEQCRQQRRGAGSRAPRSSPPPTTSPSTRTARSGRPARSPNSRTAS